MATLVLLFAGLWPAGCTDAPAPAAPVVRPRNLILISMDTVRADHLSCYGYARATTPRLDAYAKKGAIFVNCTSSSSWTVPAHLTMFTGVEPATHQCLYYGHGGRLNSQYETMAKIFTRNGFYTAGFTGGGFAGRRHGFDVGFQTFASKGRRFEDNISLAWKWIDIVKAKPFFLFLHGFNAHRPYVPPSPYKERFLDGYAGHFNIRNFRPGWPRPNPTDLAYVISQYDGEIAYIDDLLGDFLDELQRRGLLDDTLVVLTSDHGEEFYEHGGCDHIRTLYDELTRVPWIMFGPSVPAERVLGHIGTIDLLPTLISIFGLETEASFQGVDRTGLLAEAGVRKDADVFSFTGKGLPPYHLASVRTNDWKLITNMPVGRRNPVCPKCRKGEPEGKKVWLFDLVNDPFERENVAEAHPKVTRTLYQRLQERIAQSRKFRLDAQTPPPPSKEYTETLRSLGYVGGGED